MEFQEYPKWIYQDGQEPVLVQSAEEEAALLVVEKPRRGRPPKVTEPE